MIRAIRISIIRAKGHLQIRFAIAKGDRNNHRQILGYIECGRAATNTSRQRIDTFD